MAIKRVRLRNDVKIALAKSGIFLIESGWTTKDAADQLNVRHDELKRYIKRYKEGLYSGREKLCSIAYTHKKKAEKIRESFDVPAEDITDLKELRKSQDAAKNSLYDTIISGIKPDESVRVLANLNKESKNPEPHVWSKLERIEMKINTLSRKVEHLVELWS